MRRKKVRGTADNRKIQTGQGGPPNTQAWCVFRGGRCGPSSAGATQACATRVPGRVKGRTSLTDKTMACRSSGTSLETSTPGCPVAGSMATVLWISSTAISLRAGTSAKWPEDVTAVPKPAHANIATPIQRCSDRSEENQRRMGGILSARRGSTEPPSIRCERGHQAS